MKGGRTVAQESIEVIVRLKPLNEEELQIGEITCARQVENAVVLTPKDDNQTTYGTPRRTPSRSRLTHYSTIRTTGTPGSITPHKANNINFASPFHSCPSPLKPSYGHAVSRAYTFDHVLGVDASQRDVYSKIEPLVQSALMGYNATIFTYGQTGSGKTYTMMGSNKEPGIIPRAVKQLFKETSNHPDAMFEIRCSFVELYLNKFNDLLDPANSQRSLKRRTPSYKQTPITMVKTAEGSIELRGSKTLQTTVSTFKEALTLISAGTRSRKTARTQMNAHSSRSHSILTFYVEKKDATHQSISTGKLHLVDLAGSERLNKSGVEGSNQTEATKINVSLTALGDVLAALTKQQKNGGGGSSGKGLPRGGGVVVPYRNNPLTRYLQDSLGGNSHTCFIVNVQCGTSHFPETHNSLKFGHRAKSIRNSSSINWSGAVGRSMNSVDQDRLRREVNVLRISVDRSNAMLDAVKRRENALIKENHSLSLSLKALGRTPNKRHTPNKRYTPNTRHTPTTYSTLPRRGTPTTISSTITHSTLPRIGALSPHITHQNVHKKEHLYHSLDPPQPLVFSSEANSSELEVLEKRNKELVCVVTRLQAEKEEAIGERDKARVQLEGVKQESEEAAISFRKRLLELDEELAAVSYLREGVSGSVVRSPLKIISVDTLPSHLDNKELVNSRKKTQLVLRANKALQVQCRKQEKELQEMQMAMERMQTEYINIMNPQGGKDGTIGGGTFSPTLYGTYSKIRPRPSTKTTSIPRSKGKRSSPTSSSYSTIVSSSSRKSRRLSKRRRAKKKGSQLIVDNASSSSSNKTLNSKTRRSTRTRTLKSLRKSFKTKQHGSTLVIGCGHSTTNTENQLNTGIPDI